MCADHTVEVARLRQAERLQAAMRRLGGCRLPHVIEVFADSLWVPLHLLRAREILAADLGSTVETPDGPLVKAVGGWSRQAGDRANAVADPVRAPHAWIAALGPHDWTVLTADGGTGHLGGWCVCAPPPDPTAGWIRYERWTSAGRAGHGYLCRACRLLLQTG